MKKTLGLIVFTLNLIVAGESVMAADQLAKFDGLAAEIRKLMENKTPVVVAISGFGGSGKSTLADRLRDHFEIADGQIIRIDNLYSANPSGPGFLDQVDWPLLSCILEDVATGKRLHYQGRDDAGEAVYCDEAIPKVVFVEGIRLLQPQLMSHFDLSVWVDCPQDIALIRAKNRDRQQGNDEETVNRWDTDWGPKDRDYYQSFRPDLLATILYQEYK